MYGGFVSVPLNPRAGVSQLSYMLDHCDAKVAFVGSRYDALIKGAMTSVHRPVAVISAEPDGCREVSESSAITGTLTSLAAEDPCLLMYSSGTTGQPKGAIHTHRSVLAHGRNSARSHQITAADRSLLVLPLYHINAECVTLMPTLMSGGSLVIPHGFVVSEFWNWLDDYHCTWSALVPTIISQLLDWKDPKGESRAACFQRIRFLRTSSAPLSPSLHHEFVGKFKLPLIQAMGSSEAGNVFSNPVPPGANKIGSPGLAWGFETRIVDRSGADVPIGEPGEVLLRGDGMMREYYKDPSGTSEALDAERWLHTGDLAYQDEDDYFFVVGRSKELIIKGGMNIAPKQIDEILESHPSVSEAAAVGVPDRYVGEDVVAFAVLRDGMECDEGELLSFCEGRLGHFKTPSRIHFVRDLPRGPSGKVQRLKLQEEAAERSVSNDSATERGDPLAPSVASSTPIEQIIADTWAKLLKQPNVDPHSNFFSLGGHSLLAIQCLSALREKLPVRISLAEFFENATVAEQATLMRRRLRPDSISPEESTVPWELELLRTIGPQAIGDKIPPRDRSLLCPLSPNQQRVWFMEQVIAGAPVYNEAEAVRLRGNLNVEVLEKALNVIIARHENFRTTIEAAGDEPCVVVHESWPLKLKQVDLCSLAPAARQAEVERLLIDEPRAPYDLKTKPGIRATLIRCGEAEHIFILMMHHLICDWSSEGVLWRELSALYGAGCCGEQLELPPLPIHHGDYAVWLQRQTSSPEIVEELAYWEESLRGAPALLELPMDRPNRPPTISYRGARRRFLIPAGLTSALRDCSRREAVSLFTVVAAALNALLYRYSGQEDILIGIPLADRDRPELDSMIGFLLHTHVLRTQLAEDLTFRELLARVQKSVLELYAHRSPSFDRVVSRLQPERSPAYSPLFQVMLNWRDRDQQLSFIGLHGLVVESLLAESRTSKFDLTLMLTDGGDTIDLEIEYNTDLFEEARIDRLAEHFSTLLNAAAINPDGQLSDLPLLTDAEREQQIVEWNDTAVSSGENRCLHELFEEQVERTPDTVAVAFQGGHLTYRQLNERSNRLARHLRGMGVGQDTLVPICLERSLEMVVGLLSILKAGGAYVPLDPSYPRERLAYMLSDTKARILLTRQSLAAVVPVGAAEIVYIDTQWPVIAQHESHNLEVPSRPDQLAYVIYTSGSTGRPKGVCGEHRATLNRLRWMWRKYPFVPGECCCQKTVLSFVDSVWEIFGPLLQGVKAVLIAEPVVRDPRQLVEALAEAGATRIVLVPSLMQALLKEYPDLEVRLPRLRLWISSGEALGGDLVSRFFERLPGRMLLNLYGSSEAAADATCYEVTRNDSPCPAPIGRPIDNMKAYILDGKRRLAPTGVTGELYLAGAGLARGYLHQTELTQERFVENPFDDGAHRILYKTGDLARYTREGVIEYLGRIDYQIKIRGHRIELGEIESVLVAHPAVREAVVLAREDAPGEKRLVAYFSGEKSISTEVLRAHLESVLPEYMVPAAYVALDVLPLTPNGKLDRRALPAPGDNAFGTQAYEAPQGPVETAIAAIWADSLHLERVGRHDDFFKIGGHSLMALRVIGEINKTLNKRVLVPAFFQSPTIEGLAKAVEQKQHLGFEPRVVQLQSGRTGLPLYFMGAGPAEHRLMQLLGEDRAVFVIDAPMPVEWHRAIQASDRTTMPTIEQLGTHFGDVLRAHVGSSPCIIAGYSLGGKIAFEAAQALGRAGGNVELVLLVDARALTWSGSIRGPAWQSLCRIWRGVAKRTYSDHSYFATLNASLANSWRVLFWLMWRVSQKVKARLFSVKNRFPPEDHPSGLFDEEGRPLDQATVIRLAYVAGRVWRPSPLDTPGVLFRTKFPGENILFGYDTTHGWAELFDQGLEIVQVSGDHVSMVSSENIVGLAREINCVLDRYEAKRDQGAGGAGEGIARRSAGGLMSDRELSHPERAVV
jgi:amino acid adenylation domain-containing protein